MLKAENNENWVKIFTLNIRKYEIFKVIKFYTRCTFKTNNYIIYKMPHIVKRRDAEILNVSTFKVLKTIKLLCVKFV